MATMTPAQIIEKINEWITNNGVHSITGGHTNTILNAIMEYVGVGFAFMGEAPSSAPSPDVPVLYFAGPGSYTGYDDSVVDVPDGSIGLFTFNGSAWSPDVTPIKKNVDAFSGNIVNDPTNNRIEISHGYVFIGDKVYLCDYQRIDYSSISVLNYIIIETNGNSATFGLLPYSTKAADNQYIVGYIVSADKRIFWQLSQDNTWNNNQLSFVCVPTSCDITLDGDNKLMKVGAGYVFVGRNAYVISAHNVSYNDLTSINYIYFDTATSKFSITAFNNVLTTTQYICGYITTNGKVKITNVDFDEPLLKMLNAIVSDQIGIPEAVVLPSPTYLDGTFDVEQGGGAQGIVYFDTRNVISKTRKIKKLSILALISGNIDVYFIAPDYSVVHTIQIAVTAGRNDIAVTLPDEYYTQTMYVGVSSNGIYWKMASNQPTTYNGKLTVSTGTVDFITYASAYCIEVLDTSAMLKERVDAIAPFTSIEDALASGVNDIVLAPQDFEISDPIVMREGMTIRGSFGKTRLILTDGCATAISASNVNNIKISDLEIVGTCPDYAYSMNGIIAGTGYDMVEDEDDAVELAYMGTEKGVYLYYCENVVLDNLKINHITGSAIRVNHTGMNYIKGLNATNLFIENCYNGIYCENEHEFSQYTNFAITLCMIGLYVTSGNLIFTAGHLTRCRVAVEYLGGYNHAHGICNGLEIKHNQIAGILCKDIANGQQFTGCYISYCNIIIRDSKGITFDALTMGQGSIICSGNYDGAGGNYILTLFNRTGSVVINNTGNLVIQQNLNLDTLPN